MGIIYLWGFTTYVNAYKTKRLISINTTPLISIKTESYHYKLSFKIGNLVCCC